MRGLVRLGLAAITAAVVVGGCGAGARPVPARGGGTATQSASRTATTAPIPSTIVVPTGRLLVFFKRTVGLDPLASQLSVYADGQAVALITNGGINGEHRQLFTLSPARLRALRRALRTTRLHDTGCCDHRFYEYFVSYGTRSWRLQQGDVPPAERGLLSQLNSITAAHTSYTY